MQFAVGVVVLLGVFLAVILMMVNSPIPSGLSPFGRKQYELTILLPKAPGVGPETPVRKNGVLIGRVASVEDNDEGVAVSVKIDEGRTVTTHHKPHVRTSVLGDATIDFETDPVAQALERRARTDKEQIDGVVDPNPFEAISKLGELQDDIQQAMAALRDAGKSVDTLANRVTTAFGAETDEGRVKRFMDRTENAMVQFGNAMASINQILGDEPAPGGQPGGILPPVPGQQPLPQTAGQGQPVDGQQLRRRLRDGLNELPDAIHRFNVVLESADKNLKNLEGFTAPLGRNGPQIANSIVEAVDGLDTLVEEFTVLANALNRRDGTIGQLIHNPELYNRLNNLTLNADQVIRYIYEIAQRLRPVVEDARVFMDKIAREPGRVIGGAVGPPSVVK
jgi:phospholipid/cholesterol/gamma-HCH transport system substrate-binding protein